MRNRLEAHLSERFAIEREIGRGGMATVWLAHDRRHDRPVAIKVLNADLAGAIGVDRFVREVRLTARLQHPSIVPVLDSGILPADGDVPLPWYAMAYIRGESLRARLDREMQLSVDETLRIARDVAGALEVAHAQGIVHRDVKPENILLADGRVYVVDFGVAKALLDTGDDRLTSTGLALGTAAYMSPEQASAGSVDARTDQYSLAAVIYEMLAGEPPFTGPNAQATIARRLAEPARPLRPVRSGVPESVERAVLTALERVPADRFPSIAAFCAALESTGASTRTGLARVQPGARRVLMAVGLVAIAGAAAWTAFGNRVRAAAPARGPEISRLYQRGVRSYEQRTTNGAIDAIQSFKGAIGLDSTYAPAWAGLAKTYVRVVERKYQIPEMRPDSVLRLAVAALDRALALDSTDAEVWVGRAVVSRLVDPTDVRPSLRAARTAIALDSLKEQAWQVLGIDLAEQGNMSAALEAWHECVRRNPSYTFGLMFLGQGYYWHHQYDSAAVWADSSVRIDENYPTARVLVGQVEVERGNFEHAIAAFDAAERGSTDVEAANALAGRALVQARMGRRREAEATVRTVDSIARALSPTPLHTAVWVAESFAAVGNVDRALWWLARYPVRADLHYQLHVRCDAPFDAIRNDRRFRTFVAELNMAAC
jgi:tetratricopeptide (TPR) repeat protein